ncbi:MAG: hypothetical protein IPP44_14920 [Ideonella sp.]|nr:hypothetical protein [Ideonella sp.]
MRRLLIASLLVSTGAMAQVSAPLVSAPAFTGVSDSIQNMSLQAQSLAFTAGDFRPSRNHYRTKDLAAIAALSRAIQADATPSVSVTAGTPYMQTATFQAMGAPVGTNFEALGLGTPGFQILGAPPDTTLAVGPSHILQWVNSQLAVYDKAGTPLLAAPGFVNGNTIWQGMPANSLCRQFNRGDPIVQYDRIAQRWILSQFAFTGNFSNNAQCFAVSQTNNPMGAYNLYEYNFGTNLPDYGKMGVWPDALYMSYNMFPAAGGFSDARACAYDKAAMYSGLAATQICFADPNSFSYLPSDLDGTTLPPGGTPNIFVSWNWYNVAPPYTMQLTKFVPNFINPALSTFNDGFGGPTFSAVNVALPNTLGPCNDASSGSGFQCVPQVGTSQTLDTLGDRQMYRLVYRNFGTYDSLLITQSVDPDGAGARVAAVRWMEVRKPAANPPVVYQNSTFNTSADSRWMSSGAFDKLGNIAIGYSSSSSAANPSIRIAGRLKNDPKNLLRTELMVKAGTGSQTSNLERWGDYTTMQIDPVDDCTFWYTAQYIAANGSFNWRTRVAAFKFANCN